MHVITRVLECGFDAGDCEVDDIFNHMYGVALQPGVYIELD